MNHDSAVAASFRDPAGHVHDFEGRIFRTITRSGKDAFEAVLETGFLDKLVDERRLVGFSKVTDPSLLARFPDAVFLLEHPRIRTISYPYEWSFSQLRAAALLHLDIAIDALEAGVTLSDATAYNVQFDGAHPVFIDHLSFRPYVENEFWTAHGQFCDQFLNPLLLRSELGTPHNAWYRGTVEGITADQLARLLPVRSRLSLRKNVHVFLPARFGNQTHKQALEEASGPKRSGRLPKRGYEGLLRQLRRWIMGLKPKKTGPTVWGKYADDNTYEDENAIAKRDIVSDFASRFQPPVMIDLGCNTGFYAETALKAGAKAVVGYDFDLDSLDKAHRRSLDRKLPFLPLFLDAANPSPRQGWAQVERAGFAERARADAVSALAFIHHLAIGKNIPVDQIARWIIARAPVGLIEFVPKSDVTVRAMLRNRADIFDDYTEDYFAEALDRHARVVNQTPIGDSGRVLYEFERPVGA